MNNLQLIIDISSKKIQEITGVNHVKDKEFLDTVGHISTVISSQEKNVTQIKLNSIIISEVIRFFTPSSTLLDDIPETNQEIFPEIIQEKEVEKEVKKFKEEKYEMMVTKDLDLGFIADSIAIEKVSIEDSTYIIDDTCNSIMIEDQEVLVEPGDYGPEQLVEAVPSLSYDTVTSKFCFSSRVDFSGKNSIHQKLGCEPTVYKKNTVAPRRHSLVKSKFFKISVNEAEFYLDNSGKWRDVYFNLKPNSKIEVKIYDQYDKQIRLDFFILLKVQRNV